MSTVALLVCLMLQAPSTPPRDPAGRGTPDDGKCVLKGRVLDSSTGRPIKGAMVTAFLDGRSGEPPSTATDVEGRWELRGLQPGEIRTFDRTVYTRREIVDMLRSRATDVSLRDGETKAVVLVLITED